MERDFKGVWIPKEIWLNPDLTLTEKALLAEIDSLDNENGCTAGNEYFAEFFGVTERTISKSITRLKELGLVKSEFDGRIRTLRLEKISSLPRKSFYQNNTDISSISNTNKQQELFDTNKEDTYKIKAEKFVADFNTICKSLPKCQRVTTKRSKAITTLLKKYSYEEILEVFNKLEASDFCTNRSGKGWKADIDFILREDKFVSVLEGKYDNRGRKSNVEAISQGEKYRVSAEEKEEMRRAVERGDSKEY